MDKKTRGMMLGATFRLIIGLAAIIFSVTSIRSGETVSRWIVMILLGALLIFWAGLDYVAAVRRIRALKAAAARRPVAGKTARAAKTAPKAQGGKKKKK